VLLHLDGRDRCFNIKSPDVGEVAAKCENVTHEPFKCAVEHRFNVAKMPRACPQDTFCARDFAVGVLCSAKTIHRLALISEYWILPAVEAGAAVRVFFAGQPDLSRIPWTLHHLIIVLDMVDVGHHEATLATMTMNARMLQEFPGRKWYAKIDDDAFFMLPNLLHVMNRYVRARVLWNDPQVPDVSEPLKRSVVLGKLLFGTTFVSGGAGYVQSAHALTKAVHAVRANVNNCTKGYKPSEDVVLTCIHIALKSNIYNFPGMYINSLRSIVNGEHAGASLEGIVKYPIVFHWVNTITDACPVLACLYHATRQLVVR